ncbi:unnamed protein product, partial [Musa banksii]
RRRNGEWKRKRCGACNNWLGRQSSERKERNDRWVPSKQAGVRVEATESSLTHEEEQEDYCAFGCQAAMSRRWSVVCSLLSRGISSRLLNQTSPIKFWGVKRL